MFLFIVDNMADDIFCEAMLGMRDEEKKIIMIAERERRRTFSYLCSLIPNTEKADACAKQGFYHTGFLDKLQCAFCGQTVKFPDVDVTQPIHNLTGSTCPLVLGKQMF